MTLKTLIVDDEPVARRVLREELEALTGVEVVGEAENGRTALTQIARFQPDLVLLDMQMPVMSGFEVVHHLEQGRHMPAIVIVTAYDQFAIQAFEAGAIDYLMKPVQPVRLAEAVERARRLTGSRAFERVAQLQEIAAPAEKRAKRVVGRIGEEYFLLSTDEIYAFQAEGNLVWILTAERKYLASQTLNSLEERLEKSSFRRIHRNALINVEHVRKMSALSSQRWLITLGNNLEIVASRRRALAVRRLLDW